MIGIHVFWIDLFGRFGTSASSRVPVPTLGDLHGNPPPLALMSAAMLGTACRSGVARMSPRRAVGNREYCPIKPRS